MVITAKQESLVVSLWNEMKDDAPTFALKFFLSKEVLLLARLKSAIGEEPQTESTCKAATQLRKTGRVNVGANTFVPHLASIHFKASVADVHFEVLKFALFETIKEAVPYMWSEEMKEAWSQSYDHLVASIKSEM